jgi:dihydrofolate synthase/folylpolyglutamate synthase
MTNERMALFRGRKACVKSMSRGWDYKRALAELWRRSSYERGLISDPFGDSARAERGLQRMRGLLAALGNPHLNLPTVHIAGSKGKGSTGAFIASAAKEAGHRVGFYTSPHLHRFPERLTVDGRPLADDAFAVEALTVAAAARRLETSEPDLGQVTTFEMLTAMALNAFARCGCQLAVIEVGLGGRYDSTNVIDPIVSVITRIDLEHTAVLGPTYEDIAWQKAGILRRGVPSVSSPQVPAAAKTIVEAAAEVGSPLQMAGRDWSWNGTWRSFDAKGPWGTLSNLTLGIRGAHQVENASTALAALHVLSAAGILVPEESIRTGLASASWPGRFERITDGTRVIVFDGAHTPAAANALVEAWRDSEGTVRATVVLGMGADKDPRAFLSALRPLVSHLIVTRADSPRAANPDLIARAAAALGIPHEVQRSVAVAVDAATARDACPILITGSLFVVGEGREAFGLAEPDLEWVALNRGAPSPSHTDSQP